MASDWTDELARHRAAYVGNDPFPHVVLRGLFDDELLRAAAAEFVPLESMDVHFDDALQRKSTESRWEHIGPHSRELVTILHSAPFIDGLEQLTGIKGLVADHHLLGGGQHQIGAGGLLRIHADFNRHPRLGLERRLNVLLYLNDDWDESWGGHLELWDAAMISAVQRVAPSLNTLVVFSTTATSYHGHPDPLRTPPGVTRRSIATYYYTAPQNDLVPHSTMFRERPVDEPPRLREAFRYAKAAVKLLLPRRLVRPQSRARRAPSSSE